MFLVKKVRFKNFRSYGNQFTEIDLMRSKTTVISAKNGAGKTTIRAAITFGLFGKVPKINKGDLVNDVNRRDCIVEVECERDGKQVFIRRGIAPAIFDIIIDGKLIDQTASSRDYQKWLEESVIGFNLLSFQQVVSISGTEYTPFFMLSAGARRNMVEELLNITVFSRMNQMNLANLNMLKNQIQETEFNIEKSNTAIKNLKRGLDEVMSKDDDLRQMAESYINELQEKISSQKQIKEQLMSSVEGLKIDTIALKKLQTKAKKIEGIERDMEKAKRSAEKFIDFMTENSTCPTCANELTDEFKRDQISVKQAKVSEIESKGEDLKTLLKNVQMEVSEIESVQKRINETLSEVKKCDSEIEFLQRQIDVEKRKLTVNKSVSESNLKNEIVKETALLDAAKRQRIDLLVEKQYLDIQTAFLKDSGIKSRIIGQVVPILVKDINEYVNIMELGASFDIDENFNEKIYKRFNDPTTYSNLSAGEKARVDIAVLFTWRAIAIAKNSLTCNLLFLDEIFDNTLDEFGLEMFVNLLNSLENTNVFLISHRPEIIDKFESNIRIEKKGNFSVIL